MLKSSTIILFGFAILLLFLIPYTRQEMKNLTGQSFVIFFKYLLSFLKLMWNDHVLIVKNLLSPRNIIYPTLENENQINRNI